MSTLLESIYNGLVQTTWIEAIAVISGIVSVWYSRKENILVFPTGLLNTTVYIYLSLKGHLLGEASVNLYYTIMSLYGWYLWTRKDKINQQFILQITNSNTKERIQQFLFFAGVYALIYFALVYLKQSFAPEAIPWADALASASAYTAMWLMAKKKVESWFWWVVTNIASIPLYFIKGYAFTSVQFIALLILAIAGWIEWSKKTNQAKNISSKQLQKIVVLGPESTGKSTLCEALAKHYGTVDCKEYARQYLHENGIKYNFEDLLTIAKGQLTLENEALEKAKELQIYNSNNKIIIDTNMYVMKVWCEYVFNNCHTYILDEINNREYDLYLLCDIDLPWTADEMREYPDEKPRQELFAIYKDILINQNTPWGIVSGSGAERTQNAIKLIDKILG
jgi:nicotinamide mononucleotide transporter